MLIFDIECRMARAALRMSVRDLAEVAKVSTDTIIKIEKGDQVKERTLDAVKIGILDSGVDFSLSYIFDKSRAHQIAVLSGNSYRDPVSEIINKANWKYRSDEVIEFSGRSDTERRFRKMQIALLMSADAMVMCGGRDTKRSY